jgi:hypothetical protein
MGVRTVQRYERDLGLPVRRLSGQSRGKVIATKSDLDSWVKSSATKQELINRAQKLQNIEQDSRNVEQDSRNVEQESINKETRSVEHRLISEVAQGLQERANLQAQMTELRKELRVSVSKVRDNLLKLRQQVKEMQRRQDFIASVIKDYSRVRASLIGSGKRRKPN